MIRITLLTSLFIIFYSPLFAQDTLPDFTVLNRGNRIILSWKNTYPVVKQINIQRSIDSTRNFTTIMSVPDPTVPENGYVDSRPVTNTMFYRLFILLDSGRYVFSTSRRPEIATDLPADGPAEIMATERVKVAEDLSSGEVRELRDKLTRKAPAPEKFFTVMRNDSLISKISEKSIQRFRDSVVRRTRDTLLFSSVDSVIIKPFIPKVVYKPSQYVYTEPDGNVAIALQEAPVNDYSIRFFDDAERELFEVRKIRERYLTLDKANFLHAGWFFFELYENGKLKEKHKFYIPKD